MTIRKILQRPLFHVLFIGGLIAALQHINRSAEEIFISQQAIEDFEESINQTFGRNDTIGKEEIISLLAEEEILYREAKSAGYDKLPSVVTRLANVANFLQLVDAESSITERYRAALAMKLDETDIVVRRQMITLYKTALRNSAAIDGPSHQQIQQHYQKYSQQFIQPARYAFHHIYVQKAGDQGRTEIQALRESIIQAANNNSGKTLEEKEQWQISLGDVFYGGHRFPLQDKTQVEKHFGSNFSEQLESLTLKQWSPPIASVFGWHLIWIDRHSPEQIKPLAIVQKKIARELLSKAEDEHYKQQLSSLKTRYNIVTDDTARKKIPGKDSPSYTTRNNEEGIL